MFINEVLAMERDLGIPPFLWRYHVQIILIISKLRSLNFSMEDTE